jgi:hypothetical protein
MRKFLINVGCEESQTVCIEFRKLGQEAFSCDVLTYTGSYTVKTIFIKTDLLIDFALYANLPPLYPYPDFDIVIEIILSHLKF